MSTCCSSGLVLMLSEVVMAGWNGQRDGGGGRIEK
jgi:hypothetical protein